MRVRSASKGCPVPRLVNPIRNPKAAQDALFPVAFTAPFFKSGVRVASLDDRADQRFGAWEAMVEERFRYKHTLYPQRMMGAFQDVVWSSGPPVPPSRSLGIHAAHMFLGNDPLTIRGCNIMRARGFPEAAVMLVEDKQARWATLLEVPFSLMVPRMTGKCLCFSLSPSFFPPLSILCVCVCESVVICVYMRCQAELWLTQRDTAS
jgi:hypothetical protein